MTFSAESVAAPQVTPRGSEELESQTETVLCYTLAGKFWWLRAGEAGKEGRKDLSQDTICLAELISPFPGEQA
jgi:hypothetical protein